MTGSLELMNKKFFAVIFAVLIICTIIPFTGVLPVFADNFALSALQVAPFILLAYAAYISEKYPGLRILTTIWLFIIIAMIAAASFGLTVLSLLPPEFLEESIPEDEAEAFLNDFSESSFWQIILLFAGLLLASAASLAGQIRAFRIFLSQYIPIEPDSFVHKTALTALFAMILIPVVPLLITGFPPYLSPVFLEMAGEAGAVMEVVSFDVFSLFWMILASFIIAGLYINKNFPMVLERLALKKPSKTEFLYAVAYGIALVALFTAIDHAITAIWEFFGWTVTDADSVNILFAAYLTPLTAVVAAISAGFGEEIAIRGLLQPRFGIIIPSLLFASLHAFQYSWDGVLSVFIAGIIFALLRRHYNTTFSAVSHTTYDLILFCAIMLGIGI